MDRIIPIQIVDRIIRKASKFLVSKTAVKSLGKVLEEIGGEIAELAEEMAAHAKRVTIKDRDIEFAYRSWMKQGRKLKVAI